MSIKGLQASGNGLYYHVTEPRRLGGGTTMVGWQSGMGTSMIKTGSHFDRANVAELTIPLIQAMISSLGERHLIVDFSGVEVIDSVGLASLVNVWSCMARAKRGDDLYVHLDENGIARRALAGSGLSGFFKRWPDGGKID